MALLDSNTHTTLRWLRRASSHVMGAMMLLLTQLARGVGAFFNIDIQPVRADIHTEPLNNPYNKGVFNEQDLSQKKEKGDKASTVSKAQRCSEKSDQKKDSTLENRSVSQAVKAQEPLFDSLALRLSDLKKEIGAFNENQLSILQAAHDKNFSQRRFAVLADERFTPQQMSVIGNAFERYPRLSIKQANMWVANPHFSPHKMAALACALGTGLNNVRELSDIGDPHIFESLNSMLAHQNHAPLDRADFENLTRTLGSDITTAFANRDVISLSVNSEDFDLLSVRLQEASIPFEATKDYEMREISGTLSPISLFSVSPENDAQREAFAEIQSQMLNDLIETSKEDVSRSPESDAAILKMDALATPDREHDAPEHTRTEHDQPDLSDPGDLER